MSSEITTSWKLATVALTALTALAACDASDEPYIGFEQSFIYATPPTEPGNHFVQIQVSSGDTRSYWLSVPSGYDHATGREHALVFFFHGGGSNATTAGIQRADLRAIAEANDVIVVFPQGNELYPAPNGGFDWNATHCCGGSKFNDVDDVGFVDELTALLQAELHINADRIHATGFSNGAMLVHRLGAELPHVFASIAPVGGGTGGYSADRSQHLYYPEQTALMSVINPGLPPAPGPDWNAEEVIAPTAPIPVLLVRGFADEIVPYAGGSPDACAAGALCWGWWRHDLPAYPTVPSSSNTDWDVWTTANGCTPSAFGWIHIVVVDTFGSLSNVGNYITCEAQAPGSAVMRLVELDSLTHHWPTAAADVYDASERVMGFFRKHPK